MNNFIITPLKSLLLIIYVLALIAALGWWVNPWSTMVQNAATLLLAVHALELVFAFKHLHRYRGLLLMSVLLTLLYGLLHWKPLRDQAIAERGESGL